MDLCSSWTSHYPIGWKRKRCVALGLNPLELLANPSKTEFCVQDLNKNPTLPFEDASFDCVTNALSVDYLTQPLEVFAEMYRVLRPGGLACMAFTNRCFPTVRRKTTGLPARARKPASRTPPDMCPTWSQKVVPIWTRPFTEAHHAQIVGSYFRYSADWSEIGVADVSPDGWVGQRDPMVVVIGRK